MNGPQSLLTMIRHGVEVPLARDTFELVIAAVGECEAGSGDEVSDGAGYEDFAGLCQSGDTRADRDSYASDLAVGNFAFAGVQSGANLDAQFGDSFRNCLCACDRAGWAVEPCEKAVTGGIHFNAAESGKLPANQVVVSLQETPPLAVAQLGHPFG